MLIIQSENLIESNPIRSLEFGLWGRAHNGKDEGNDPSDQDEENIVQPRKIVERARPVPITQTGNREIALLYRRLIG
jgi:hypothetical protein